MHQSKNVDPTYSICSITFLHINPLMPAGEKLIFTVVIH